MKPKFRAWDVYEKKMFTNDQIIVWNGNVYANDNSKLNVDNLKGWSIDEKYLMQSTGLVDKNGVEIFEGDVVKLFDKDLYVVEWSSQEASYKLIPVDKQWSDCYFSNYENITKIIEVVGNIWEDGELLDS